MSDPTVEHDGDGFLSAVWMPGEPCFRVLGGQPELIEHEERIEVPQRRRSQRPTHSYPCPFAEVGSSHHLPCLPGHRCRGHVSFDPQRSSWFLPAPSKQQPRGRKQQETESCFADSRARLLSLPDGVHLSLFLPPGHPLTPPVREGPRPGTVKMAHPGSDEDRSLSGPWITRGMRRGGVRGTTGVTWEIGGVRTVTTGMHGGDGPHHTRCRCFRMAARRS